MFVRAHLSFCEVDVVGVGPGQSGIVRHRAPESFWVLCALVLGWYVCVCVCVCACVCARITLSQEASDITWSRSLLYSSRFCPKTKRKNFDFSILGLVSHVLQFLLWVRVLLHLGFIPTQLSQFVKS